MQTARKATREGEQMVQRLIDAYMMVVHGFQRREMVRELVLYS